MDRQEFKDHKQVRLEYILMGMALARTGDREKIIDDMGECDIISERNRLLLKAIEHKDVAKVLDVLHSYGVATKDGEPVRESIMKSLKGMNRQAMIDKRLRSLVIAGENQEEVLMELVQELGIA